MSYAVVDLPAKLRKDLPLADYPRLRVRGAINDGPAQRSIATEG